MNDISLKEIEKKLQNSISASRLEHTMGVMETAVELAKEYHVNTQKIKLAALLHDCARDFSDQQLLVMAYDYGIQLDYVYQEFPAMLHGPVGAVLAEREYGVKDSEVLQAIAVHTLGEKVMDDLTKVLMIADSIEPGRRYQGVIALREQVTKAGININAAALACLEFKIQSVIKSKYLLHPLAIHARNTLLMAIGKE